MMEFCAWSALRLDATGVPRAECVSDQVHGDRDKRGAQPGRDLGSSTSRSRWPKNTDRT